MPLEKAALALVLLVVFLFCGWSDPKLVITIDLVLKYFYMMLITSTCNLPCKGVPYGMCIVTDAYGSSKTVCALTGCLRLTYL
jgi:hypothetical protein